MCDLYNNTRNYRLEFESINTYKYIQIIKIFNNEANTYQDALNEVGFTEKLKYTDPTSSTNKKKPRSRN